MVSQPISLGPRPTAAQQLCFPQVTREYQYGMPSSFMTEFYTSPSIYADNSMTIFSPFHPHNASSSAINNNLRVSQPQAGLGLGQQSFLPPLTNHSLQTVRQVVDDSNHDLVYMMTQQICNVFNPLIHNTSNSYQQLAHQMGRIADFFGAPQPQVQPLPII